ncbi:hypothetical protein EPN44_15180 [bacterium]|nr:MAG: hypothetical protein EPN44_15180 [bacterium]
MLDCAARKPIESRLSARPSPVVYSARRLPGMRGTRFISCVAALLLPLAQAGAQGAAMPAATISLQSGQSTVVSAPNLSRVAVGDGRIAGVVPVGTSQVIVNAKAPGHTTLIIWEGGQRVTYDVAVSEQSLEEIVKVLRSSITAPGVSIVTFEHSLVLKGSVPDEASLQSLDDTVARFSKVLDTDHDTVVNVVSVAHPMGGLASRLTAIPGAKGVRIDRDEKGNVIVSGPVTDRATAQKVLDGVRGLAGPYLAVDGKVVDRLEVESVSQIDVKVYVLELDRTALNQLGIRLQAAVESPQGLVFTPPFFPIVENPQQVGSVGKALNIGGFFRTAFLAPTLDLLLSSGHGRILSSPDLVAMPGHDATFLVGGEIPIPFSSGLGQVSVVYKEFGVKLNVTPSLLGNGDVDTKVAPEVSELDFQDGVQISGFTIPALKTSRLSTEVITQPGQSIIMGGLLRRVEQRNIQRVPLLGDLPILGKLFRSTRYQADDSDVVFVMTPEIVTR